MARDNINKQNNNLLLIRYFLVLALLAILSAVSYKILELTTDKLELTNSVLSISQKQVILSEKISNLIYQLVFTSENSNSIDNIKSSILSSLELLENNDKYLNNTFKGDNNQLGDIYNSIYHNTPYNLRSEYLSFSNIASDIVSKNTKPSTSNFNDLIRNEINLTNGYIAVFDQFQNKSQFYTSRLKMIEKTVLVVFLSVLFFMGMVVFYPMNKKIFDENKKLKQAEAYTRAIVETAADGVITTNEKGEIRSFNGAAENIFQYRSFDIIGKNINKLIQEIPKSNSNEILSGIKSGEVNGKRWDGTDVPLDLSFSNTKPPTDKIYIFIVRDITERKRADEELKNAKSYLEKRVIERTSELSETNEQLKQEVIERKNAEQALRESERRFRIMADTAPVMIWVSNINGNNTFFNKGWLDFRGKELQIEVGDGWINGIHPEDKELYIKKRSIAFDSKQEYKLEFRLCRFDGTYRWVLDNGTPRILSNGKFAGYIGSTIDITDLKKAEEDIIRVQKLESLGSLAGGIAHEYNNILMTIIGNLSLIKSDLNPSGNLLERLDIIEEASRKAQKLANKFLTYSKGGEPILRKTSIQELITSTVNAALYKSKVIPKYSIPYNLWFAEVDKKQFSDALSYLISSRLGSIPETDYIEIKAENVLVDSSMRIPVNDGEYIRITLADHGKIISKEEITRIFDPFYSIDNKLSGMNLATAYSIIRKHGGNIIVDSNYIDKTQFHVYIPGFVKIQHGNEISSKSEGGSKGTILLMDDDVMIRQVTGRFLKRHGYDVDFAANGSEALGMYKNAKKSKRVYSAVILDLTVPEGMGGEEAMKLLMEYDPNIICIVMSGYSDNPVMAHYEDYGFKDYLAKPFNMKELNGVVDRVLFDMN